MTRATKKDGLTIPWPLIAVLTSILLASIGGAFSLYGQLSAIKERVDFLYSIEMSRYPRTGPPAPK